MIVDNIIKREGIHNYKIVVFTIIIIDIKCKNIIDNFSLLIFCISVAGKRKNISSITTTILFPLIDRKSMIT